MTLGQSRQQSAQQRADIAQAIAQRPSFDESGRQISGPIQPTQGTFDEDGTFVPFDITFENAVSLTNNVDSLSATRFAIRPLTEADLAASTLDLDSIVQATAKIAFNVDRVDYAFISAREGGVRQTGYVPIDENGNAVNRSGVTIGGGVDLGQQSVTGLRTLGVSEEIIAAVEPYLGLRTTDALTYLSGNPLTLSSNQASSLTNILNQATVSEIAETFDAASTSVRFYDLPAGAQTVIADVAFQYGTDLAQATPNFFRQVTTGDFQGALNNLMNFEDDFPSRRRLEASLLRNDIQNGLLPPR